MARVFWVTVFVGASTMFGLQLVQCITQYAQFQKRVSVEIEASAAVFPHISICNMRNLDVLTLNAINTFFNAAESTEELVNITTDPFIVQYMRHISKLMPMYYNKNRSDHSVFDVPFSRTAIATNIPHELIRPVGVQLNDFVMFCRYAGNECNRSRFHDFFDSYYFNCFTYVHAAQASHGTGHAEGLENGWSAIVLSGNGMLEVNQYLSIIPGAHEFLSAASGTEGVRVVIHPPGTEPYPRTEGFDVPPGYAASFGVKMREIVRIGPPHGNCSRSSQPGVIYRQMSCQKNCLQRFIVQQCQCKDGTLPGYDLHPNVTFCTSTHEILDDCRVSDAPVETMEACEKALYDAARRADCAKRTRETFNHNAELLRSCNCQPPCEEIAYDVTYSLSKWPARGFDGDEAAFNVFTDLIKQARKSGVESPHYELVKSFFNLTFNPNDPDELIDFRRTATNELSKLNVYIADSNVLKTEELPDYTTNQLLSDIGGQLGLWIGTSVITVVEVLSLFAKILRFAVCRLRFCSEKRYISATATSSTHQHNNCTSSQVQNHIINNHGGDGTTKYSDISPV
jgi:hypothetical protein